MPSTVRLLIVDDDKDDCLLVRDLLSEAKRTSFVVDEVYSAEDALVALRKVSYDVALIDYRLPTTNGLELVDKIRSSQVRTPIILMTSHGDRRIQTEALSKGVAEYLEKGVFSIDLLERTGIYAIGLNQQAQTEVMGMGLMFNELLNLTRDSVRAQTEMSSSMSQVGENIDKLHKDVQILTSKIDELKTTAEAQSKLIITEVNKSSLAKFGSFLEWVRINPGISAITFVVIVLLIIIIVLSVNALTPTTVKHIKDLFSAASS